MRPASATSPDSILTRAQAVAGIAYVHARGASVLLTPNTYPAPDYWKLVTGEEDPDTLFFTRRLKLEGDTELGLLVKNTLDALEPFDPGALLPGRWRLPGV